MPTFRWVCAVVAYGVIFNVGAHYAGLTDRQFFWVLGAALIADLCYTTIKE